MKNFKTWEKKTFNSLLEILYKLRLSISNGWKKFIKKGNEKVTIMLIPHNHKKIKNIHLSNFTLSFFIVFITVLVIMIFLSVSRLSIYSQELSDYKVKASSFESMYSSITDKVTEIFGQYNSTMKEFNKISQIYNKAVTDVEGVGGPEVNPMENEIIHPEQLLESMNSGLYKLFAYSTELLKRKEELAYMARWFPTRHPFYNKTAYITSPFGFRKDPFNGLLRFHSGLDMNGGYGAPIVATADGIVSFAGTRMGYGLCIIIDHKDPNKVDFGYQTLYGHLSFIGVKKDQRVKKGQIIAKEGQTGRATGPHLHYQIMIGGKVVNPEPWVFYYTEDFFY